MAWTIEYADTAKRSLKRLDRQTARRIVDFLDTRIAPAEDPRQYGAALTGSFSGAWRYRVGDYRVICKIQDETIRVLVLTIGHRREVYRGR